MAAARRADRDPTRLVCPAAPTWRAFWSAWIPAAPEERRPSRAARTSLGAGPGVTGRFLFPIVAAFCVVVFPGAGWFTR